MNDQIILKIILLGSSGVGKTCVIKRFAHGEFGQTEPTIECGETNLKVSLNGMNVIIRILDTVGQEKFNSIPNNYYRKALGVIVVYDVLDMSSYMDVSNQWLKKVIDYCPEAVVLIAGNKSDKLIGDKCVNVKSIERMAELEKYVFVETSAKSGANVKEAFQEMLRLILLKTNSIREDEELNMKVHSHLTQSELLELGLQEEDEQKKREFKLNLNKIILKQLNDADDNTVVPKQDDATQTDESCFSVSYWKSKC